MQITTYLRLKDQSSNLNILIRSMIDNYREMIVLGYHDEIFFRSLFSLSLKSKIWAPIAEKFYSILKNLNLTDGNIMERFKKYISQLIVR